MYIYLDPTNDVIHVIIHIKISFSTLVLTQACFCESKDCNWTEIDVKLYL